MSAGVHAAASAGFGRAGADYERGRPGYPSAALDHLVATLGLAAGVTVLDLAAGTGKLTRALTTTGAQVIAVEPVAGMRERLRAASPGVQALEGTAERIPLPDGAVEAVTVAQAFHWFDAVTAAAEIHRVLGARGRLAVIWNAWDEQVPWVASMLDIIHAHAGDAPQHRTSRWPEHLGATGRFSDLAATSFAHVVSGDRDTLVARVVSTSYIAALPTEDRERVARDVLAVIDADPATAGSAAIAMPYTTHVAWCQRR